MNKIFFLSAAAALTVLLAGCSKGEREAPDGLGKISFASSRTWVIDGAGITQTWSDVVVASGAKDKTTFYGLGDFDYDTSTYVIKADWRNNPGYSGTLFSWEAVDRYQDYLCPSDWRVPAREDFYNLIVAFGGTGSGQNDATIRDKYLTIWGGEYGGRCLDDGSLYGQGRHGIYWSLTPTQVASNMRSYYALDIDAFDEVSTVVSYAINGASVRCVK